MRTMKRYFHGFPSPLPLIFIVLGTIAVILYGRGYRPDTIDKSLKPTGLLSATSDPVGSQVFIDGVLKTATDNTINVDPGWYTVSIVKEGYIPWQKKLRVQGEVVTRTDPFLFPTNPSLSPLTTIGIETPVLSPDGTKIAYTIPIPKEQNGVVPAKAGLWAYELAERPLGFNRDQRQVGTSNTTFSFSSAEIVWSPDSTQLMVKKPGVVRLYQATRLDDFQDISGTYQSILTEWKNEQQVRTRQRLSTFKQGVIDIATSSATILSFSPDETKILYEATASATIPEIINPLIGTNPTPEERDIKPGRVYVYDSREDKNYFIMDKKELPITKTTPTPSPNTKKGTIPKASPVDQLLTTELGQSTGLHWFPTSRHLVLTLEGKIDIMEYDRTNWVTVYSGPFIDNFLAIWPNGSRIIVMTNLNPGVSSLPNLYTVNLR